MTISNLNQMDFNGFKPKRDLLWLILFISVLVILTKQFYEKSKLKYSKDSLAKVVEKSGGYKNFPTLVVQYQIDGKTIISNFINQNECFDKYYVGDSLNIRTQLKIRKLWKLLDVTK